MDRKRGDEELTERLQRELRSCLDNFQSIISRSADTILIVDREGIIRYANPAATDLFGRDTGEVVGQVFGFPVIDGERTEIEIVRQELTPVVVEMRTAQTNWEGESAWLATLRDVTERKELERGLHQALKESEESRAKLDSIIRSMTEGLIVADNRNRVVLINPPAEKLFGVACHRVTGLPMDHFPIPEAVKGKLLDRLVKGQGSRVEFEIQSPGENAGKIIQADMATVRDRRDNNLGTVILLKDITEQRKLDRMKSEFISTTAHELRTPLTSILGYADILVEGDFKPKEQQEFLMIIRDRAKALSEMVKELLDVARIESGQGIPLKLWPWPVRDCVGQMRPIMKIQESLCQFEIALEDDSIELLVDKEKIGQVIQNLLSNAVKYSPEGGIIRIEGKMVEEGYQLCVSDEGIGMTADQVEKVFDKFFRVDGSNTSIGGLGLGMSIVKNIVEAHRGTIRVESEPKRGTRVFVTLPAAKSG